MKSWLRLSPTRALGLSFGVLLGCSQEPAPSATHENAFEPAVTAVSPAAAAEAATLFATRCSPCHGTSGAGDGAAAAALNPRPRNFHDQTWQSTVTDQQIEKVIVQGGPSIGRSPLMPPNPDLANRAEIVIALRAQIRAAGQPAGAQPAGRTSHAPPGTPAAHGAVAAIPAVPQVDVASLPTIQAELGIPPHAAPPVNRRTPAHVVVNIEVLEVTREIADGATYTFWTFGGTVPGPMIRVRRGDIVELHLQNHPRNSLPHNIDLHAVTGPGGGAASTFAAPGHQAQFSFQALNSGVYIYHCATAPVGMHVANGMYGLIVVEPEEGYPPVDREYYIAQGDFYTTAGYRQPGLSNFDMLRAIDERPTYVLFNGRDGALTGDRALTANVGETMRIFFGNGGPNLVSSFHIIGEIFDRVWNLGEAEPNTNVQTTLVPPGGAAIVDFRTEVPGNLVIVDHSLFRTFHKGSLGLIRVTGPENPTIYSGRQSDSPYNGEHITGIATAPPTTAIPIPAGTSPGERTFLTVCAACHQRTGVGIPAVFPPLAGSDFAVGDRNRVIHALLAGLNGPIVVNGLPFSGAMPPLANLTDQEIADVLTWVRSNLGNHGPSVTPAQVAAIRTALAHPSTPAAPAAH